MKGEYIIPFVTATVETFDTMCELCPVRDGDVVIQRGVFPSYDTIAVIGLSGELKGAVMLTMPLDVACDVVGRFAGEELSELNEDLTDGFGELLNIIAGAAVAKLPDLKLKITLPTVMSGANPVIASKNSSPWYRIPMRFNGVGKFSIKVSMEEA